MARSTEELQAEYEKIGKDWGAELSSAASSHYPPKVEHQIARELTNLQRFCKVLLDEVLELRESRG